MENYSNKGCGKMMSELTRLRDEAIRLHTIYDMHKDSEDESLRRKVHLDLDRFLMEHRETAIILMAEGLNQHIESIVIELPFEKRVTVPWYKRLFGGAKNGNSKDKVNQESEHTIKA